MGKYILKQPIMFEGEQIKELKLDLDSLTYRDLAASLRETKARLPKKESLAVPETNKIYQACVGARAAGVPAELIFSLKANDFTQITILVMNFLLDGDSDEEEAEEAQLSTPSNQLNMIPLMNGM